MKVSEFIEKLLQEDQDDIVIMSKDSEGNYYSPVSDIEKYIYVPDNNWSGDVYIRELQNGYTDEDLYHGENGVNAVVIYPTN